MGKTRFARTAADGTIHGINVLNEEHTLCSIAFDDYGEMDDSGGWEYVRRGPITCHECLNLIRWCRGYRLPRVSE